MEKSVCYLCGFWFFFPKSSPFWNLKLDFFPLKKSFSKIFQNTAHFFYLNFISKKKTKKSENPFFTEKSACYQWGFWFFFPKYPRFWNLKSDFFPLKKSFLQIFQNTANFFYLNFISVNFHKNQRIFLRAGGREVGSS